MSGCPLRAAGFLRRDFPMKKLNRTYIMGIVFIILALWVLFQTTQIPEKLVSTSRDSCSLYISAIGMIVMAVLSK